MFAGADAGRVVRTDPDGIFEIMSVTIPAELRQRHLTDLAIGANIVESADPQMWEVERQAAAQPPPTSSVRQAIKRKDGTIFGWFELASRSDQSHDLATMNLIDTYRQRFETEIERLPSDEVIEQWKTELENYEAEQNDVGMWVPSQSHSMMLTARMDAGARYRSANRRYMAFFNQTAASIHGKHMSDILGDEAWLFARPFVDQVLAGFPVTYETRFPRHFGHRTIQVNYVPEFDAAGTIDGFAVFTSDVHDRVEAIRQLAANEALTRATLQSIADGVVITDWDGRIVQMNPVAERFTGFSLLQARDQSVSSVLKLVDRATGESLPDVLNLADYAVDSRLLPGVNVVSSDGHQITTSVSVSAIRSDRMEPLGFVFVIRDIARVLELNDRLRSAERLEAIGKLAGGVAHDFNNLLASMVSAAEVINATDGGALSERSTGALDVIFSSARRAADLVSGLLAFGGDDSPSMTIVDLNSLVDDVVRDAAVRLSGRSIPATGLPVSERIESDSEPNVPIEWRVQKGAKRAMVAGHEPELRELLTILFQRLATSDPPAQVIAVGTAEVDSEDLYGLKHMACAGVSAAGCVEITIRKYTKGPGLKAAEQRSVGDGISLYRPSTMIDQSLVPAVRICQHHSGELLLNTPHDVGSYVVVRLPAADEWIDLAATPADGRDRDAVVVLFVDDEELVCVTAEMLLQELGCDVITASNGAEALRIFRERHDELALVILDVKMPLMGGIETFEVMKSIDPRCPIVFSTGYADDFELDGLVATGASGMLSKPYRLNELKLVVDAAIVSHAQTQE